MMILAATMLDIHHRISIMALTIACWSIDQQWAP